MQKTSCRLRVANCRGFTLIELVLAVTLLAAFVLPILYLLTEAKARTYRFTQERKIRDLAHSKLFDRIHYYETNDSGTFEDQGRTEQESVKYGQWTWEVPPPQVRGQSEQVLLEYTIHVRVPHRLGAKKSDDPLLGDMDTSTYEYSVWTFPDERWFEEQQYLYETGQASLLYGDPLYEGATGALLPGDY